MESSPAGPDSQKELRRFSGFLGRWAPSRAALRSPVSYGGVADNPPSVSTARWETAHLFFWLVLIVALSNHELTTAKEIALNGGFLLWALQMVVARRRVFVRTGLEVPFVLWLVFALFSTIHAVDPLASLWEIRGELVKGCVLFLWVSSCLRRRISGEIFLLSLSAVTVLVAAIGIVVFFLEHGRFLSIAIRAHGFYNDYNYFSSFLLIGMPYLLVAGRIRAGWVPRVLWGACLVVAAMGFYLSHTRSSWIAVFVELVVVLVLLQKRRIVYFLACFLLVALGAAVAFVPKDVFFHRIPYHNISSSSQARVVIWRFVAKEISRHPFTGIGFGRDSFKKAYPQFTNDKLPEMWNTHNYFLSIALETGIQGLIVFAVILAILAVKFRNYARRPSLPSSARHVAYASMAMLAGITVSNLMTHMFIDEIALSFWLVMGISLAYVRVCAEHANT